jgi:hypothetical protein
MWYVKKSKFIRFDEKEQVKEEGVYLSSFSSSSSSSSSFSSSSSSSSL